MAVKTEPADPFNSTGIISRNRRVASHTTLILGGKSWQGLLVSMACTAFFFRRFGMTLPALRILESCLVMRIMALNTIGESPAVLDLHCAMDALISVIHDLSMALGAQFLMEEITQ